MPQQPMAKKTQDQEQNQTTEAPITSSLPGWAGVGILALGCWATQGSEPYVRAAQIMAAMWITMALLETHTRLRRLQWQTQGWATRWMQKMTGTALGIGAIAGAYWMLPEYSGTFYNPFYNALKSYWWGLGGLLALSMAADSLLKPKETDPAQEWGKALLGLSKPQTTKTQNLDFWLGWAIKGYFLPLMFVYFCQYLGAKPFPNTTIGLYDQAYHTIYLIDTAFVCVGYAFASRIAGTHLRSAEKTTSGWVVALICYQPFWGLIGGTYIHYGSSFTKLPLSPMALNIYIGAILACLWVYLWATIVFGSRFSNLTHRGIIRCGPYKYMRHPAYCAKLAAYLLMYVPFATTSPTELIRNMSAWGLLCLVYYARAKTEERNLRSTGPEYDLYCQFVRESRKNLTKKILG
jgi:protein-S-isoprenylcysteine O-methyltransferase Ste14